MIKSSFFNYLGYLAAILGFIVLILFFLQEFFNIGEFEDDSFYSFYFHKTIQSVLMVYFLSFWIIYLNNQTGYLRNFFDSFHFTTLKWMSFINFDIFNADLNLW